MNQKQQTIIEKSKCTDDKGNNLKANYKLVPVGAYLHAALREETHTNYDDAARSLDLVAKWKPDFPFLKQDLDRVKNGAALAAGQRRGVRVHAGRARAVQGREGGDSPAPWRLLIADRILSAAAKQSVPPNLAPIKIPHVVRPVNHVANVVVGADGKPAGRHRDDHRRRADGVGAVRGSHARNAGACGRRAGS